MGVDHPVRVFFLIEVIKNMHQNAVFKHVGVVGGMECVAIAEQGLAFEVGRRHSVVNSLHRGCAVIFWVYIVR
jgi:hypothetical protein